MKFHAIPSMNPSRQALPPRFPLPEFRAAPGTLATGVPVVTEHPL